MGKGTVETEVKLRVADAESARAALSGIAATLERARHFEDNLLLDDERRSLQSRESALRIRRVDAAGVVTFKGPRRIVEGIKSREEIESSVADADALQSLFLALGYRPVFRYQKYRTVYRWTDVEIVLDETPIGTFLEIEGEIASVHRAAAALGFGTDQYVADSYIALFFAGGGQGDMVFR